MNKIELIEEYSFALTNLITEIANYVVHHIETKRISLYEQYGKELAIIRQKKLDAIQDQTINENDLERKIQISIYEDFCNSVLNKNEYTRMHKSFMALKKESIMNIIQLQKQVAKLYNQTVDKNDICKWELEQINTIYKAQIQATANQNIIRMLECFSCGFTINVQNVHYDESGNTYIVREYIKDINADCEKLLNDCLNKDNQLIYPTISPEIITYLNEIMEGKDAMFPLLEEDVSNPEVIELLNLKTLSEEDSLLIESVVVEIEENFDIDEDFDDLPKIDFESSDYEAIMEFLKSKGLV